MYVAIYVSRCLKEELVLAIDIWLQTVNKIITVSYTTNELKNKAILKQFCMHCYVVLSNIMKF